MGNTNKRQASSDLKIQPCGGKIPSKFALIWLDQNIDMKNKDCQKTITELQRISNFLTLLKDLQACRQFLNEPREERLVLVISGSLFQQLEPFIGHYSRLYAIYIFCGRPDQHSWATKCNRVKCISKNIREICNLIVANTVESERDMDAVECDEDLTPTGILSPNFSSSQELQQLNASFVYSQLIKEIIMDSHDDLSSIKDFILYCLDKYRGDEKQRPFIDEFEKEYKKHSPIWWYTRRSFAYRIMHDSFRRFDIEVVYLMAFFIKDIQKQIDTMHSNAQMKAEPFVVYHGQAMLNEYFENVEQSKSGFIAFNTFVLTTKRKHTAEQFAERSRDQIGKTAILFEIEYNPVETSVSFASLDGVNYHNTKSGIIFSMHTVFRIIHIEGEHNNVRHIKLESVKDNDEQLIELNSQLKSNIGGVNATDQLGRLMMKFREFQKAEVLYNFLLESTPDADRNMKAWVNNQLGRIEYEQGNFNEARSSYDESEKMLKSEEFSNKLDLATMYSNIGELYTAIGQAVAGLPYHLEALKIRENNREINRLILATTYDNIGVAYHKGRDFSNALSYYEKALPIYQETLGDNHPSLATIYKNIVYAQKSSVEPPDTPDCPKTS